MEIKLPTDCGNAPRISIVSEFAVSWARAGTQTVSSWLTDTANWTLVGEGTHCDPEA